jgi:carbon-monoxide dehydrogenase medium subunit
MKEISYRHLPRFDHLEPKTVEEACSLLSKYDGKAKVIAGGTDLLPSMRNRKVTPGYIINIKRIPNLDYIDYDDAEGLRIGALVTVHDIQSSSIIREKFPILANAASKIGTPQVRNMGTIGGNLCNAAPSADTAPPLIGLEAKVKINSPNGERVVALEEFFTGPGESVLQAGEILTEIQIPNPLPHTRGVYLKLPARSMVDLAVVGVAVVVTLDDKEKSIVDAKIVLGAVAPTPIRARQAEAVIKGKAISRELIEKATEAAADEAKPISDVRGSASYRKEMVKILTKRGIKQLIASANIGDIGGRL